LSCTARTRELRVRLPLTPEAYDCGLLYVVQIADSDTLLHLLIAAIFGHRLRERRFILLDGCMPKFLLSLCYPVYVEAL
jgi:hypothetical protein